MLGGRIGTFSDMGRHECHHHPSRWKYLQAIVRQAFIRDVISFSGVKAILLMSITGAWAWVKSPRFKFYFTTWQMRNHRRITCLNPSIIFWAMGILEATYFSGFLYRLEDVFHAKWLEHKIVMISSSNSKVVMTVPNQSSSNKSWILFSMW